MSRTTVAWNSGIAVVLLAVALVSAVHGAAPMALVLTSVVLPFGVGVVLASFRRGWLIGVLMLLAVGVPLLGLAGLTGFPLGRAAWFLSVLAGWFVGAIVGSRRDQHGTGPGGDQHHLDWDVRGKTFREWSPTVAQVEAKVRALDGRDRTLVSVVRGHGRLDVCNGANGLFVLFEAGDVRDDASWRMPAKPALAEEVEVRMGDIVAPVDRGLLIDLDRAVAIATAFALGTAVRPEPDWWEGPQVLTVRPSFV
jgi:hypothetical protein